MGTLFLSRSSPESYRLLVEAFSGSNHQLSCNKHHRALQSLAFLFLFYYSFYIFALSAFACCCEVPVTSVSLPPFVSRRGLFNTNQRLSLTDIVINIIITSSRCPESLCCDAPPDPSYQRPYSPSPLRALVSLRYRHHHITLSQTSSSRLFPDIPPSRALRYSSSIAALFRLANPSDQHEIRRSSLV